MGRPKGSTNKVVKAVKKAIESKPEVKPREIMPHEKTSLVFICGGCQHEKDLHYDGAEGHCNTMNCSCLKFK